MLRVWSFEGGESYLFPQYGAVYSTVFSEDGKYMLVGCYDGGLNIYDWRDQKNISEGEGYRVGEVVSFKRFLAWIEKETSEIHLVFAKIRDRTVTTITLSRRGFLAIGYKDGKIEIIREGKGI